MQTLSNVLNLTVKVAETDQAPALGAAIYAAVAGGFIMIPHRPLLLWEAILKRFINPRKNK